MIKVEEEKSKREEVNRTIDKVNRFLKKDMLNDEGRIAKEIIQEDIQILTIDEWKNSVIKYDRMHGRPSVTIKIQEEVMECLLDTGARINVMSWKMFQKLTGIELTRTTETLRCANDGPLETKGKAEMKVVLNGIDKIVLFTIVEKVTPDVIGGIEMQKQFGIELQWIDEESKTEMHDHICNITAQFGRKISSEERFQKAKEAMKINDQTLKDVISRNRDVFMADKWDIGCTTLMKHTIETQGSPINVKPRRQPINLEQKIDEAIDNLWKNNIIRKCNSPWNTPLICVWKKEKQDIRLCLDFRQLNLVTKRQAFPMPNIAEMLDKLGGARYFTSIDLGNAYYQVELEEQSKEKTAFSTKMGQFCFNRMPFGIAAAPGTFQELMLKVLQNMEGTAVYLDDILIFTESVEEHYRILEEVLRRIGRAGLRINPDKCQVLRKEVKFLGHIINGKGIQTDPSKTEAIKSFQRPKCVKNLRSFLGICNYYRKFIKGYSDKARALEELCGKNRERKLIWPEKCEKAFEEMKNALVSSPILGFPDFRKEFILDTDASFDTIGAVLSQIDDQGCERVIAYGSHAMNAHEKGYCITRKELLAIYYFCQHFSHYLYGKRFTLRTDHKAVTFMLKTKKPITSQFQTWINLLSSYDINMVYRKGSNHANADMLSRNTCGTCTQCLMEHEDAKEEKMKTRRINMVDNDDESRWQVGSAEIKQITDEINRGDTWEFMLDNNVVKTNEAKIWIPTDKRQEMIKTIHNMLSHAGAEKIMRYIRTNYDMRNMAEIVKEAIRQCEPCQRVKVVTTATKEETIKLTAREPFEKIYIDICGPLQETFRKKKYIMAMIDQFSRYIILTPIARQDEKTITETILNKWILKFGAPKEIHMDCGKSFESKAMSDLAKGMKIKLFFSSPYHHNTNGVIERQFRTIRDYINASLRERKKNDWSEILPDIEFTMNATVQKSIGQSPAEIIFGRKINREQWHTVLEPKMNEEEERMKDTTTKRLFYVGDQVLVKVESRTKDKDRYEGPYRIIQKEHDRRYRLVDESGKTVTRNVEKLKPFFKEGGCEGVFI